MANHTSPYHIGVDIASTLDAAIASYDGDPLRI
jgi:hypothetical protein